jgi:putative transposase
MQFLPNHIYHVYNQGNNRQRVFFNDEDYFIFLNLYRKLFEKNCDTIAWCLMPNHFHFMIYTDERSSIKIKQGGIFLDTMTNGIRKLLSSYARIFNNRKDRTGSLFRQKTKSKSLSDLPALPESNYSPRDYYVHCFHYIHQNPMRANLVSRLEDWQFSSFRDYANLRNGSLCKKELASLFCEYNSENFITKSNSIVEEAIIKLIK